MIEKGAVEHNRHLLDKFTDGALEEELRLRKEDRDKKHKEDMEKRAVRVECPRCNGHGVLKTEDNSLDLGYPVTCSMCNGFKTIVAYRSNSTL